MLMKKLSIKEAREFENTELYNALMEYEKYLSKVTATGGDGGEWSVEDNKVITGKVINKAGSLLPSTGGIGTTIFYVIGGVLVVLAVGILIVRKRRR